MNVPGEFEFNSQKNFFSDPSPNHTHNPKLLFKPSNMIVVYTTLKILNAMRSQLGLEAMLEYIDKYLFLTERDNPRLKTAVTQALTLMSVEKIYRDAVHSSKE